MSAKVLIVGELDGGRVVPSTLEAMGVGGSVAGGLSEVAVLLAGGSAATAVPALESAGASNVLLLEDPRLDGAPAAATAVVAAAAATHAGASTVLLGGTTSGREVAGRLAARWNATVTSGATEVRADGAALVVRRPVFGGRATETVRLDGPRHVVAVRPHAFPAPGGPTASAAVERLSPVEIPPTLLAPRRTAVEATPSGAGPSLGDAAIVVSGGRGVRGPEHFHLVEELAASLGAAVGASRAVTDAGWRPASLQVGQTGRSVSPQLYIAVGISGAIQHLVGMVSSRVIVAINNDPTAPIFKVADYGIVGDLFPIVPALTAEVKRARSA